MQLARAVAAGLLIRSTRPPSGDPVWPAAPGCRNGHRRTPLLDWLNPRPGSPGGPRDAT